MSENNSRQDTDVELSEGTPLKSDRKQFIDDLENV